MTRVEKSSGQSRYPEIASENRADRRRHWPSRFDQNRSGDEPSNTREMRPALRLWNCRLPATDGKARGDKAATKTDARTEYVHRRTGPDRGSFGILFRAEDSRDA